MVVVTSLFNLVISSFPDNMFYHVWTWLLIYHDGSNNVVQVCSFIKPRTVCSNIHEQACQHSSRWPAQLCSSLSTTQFKLASSTMFEPVNTQNKLCRFLLVSKRGIKLLTTQTRPVGGGGGGGRGGRTNPPETQNIDTMKSSVNKNQGPVE